ncbi:hypothetical protein [Micromonospora yasonensis]|uniref:hypothetical protein n=1 Tax=Micromonospora yasonensis TaxID=1128667 RepID=UPI0029F4AD8C|nr:hypothetical protein [Micromonospora yasonensis]
MVVVPRDEADGLEWLAFEQAGVLTSAQATRLLSEGTVRGRVRSGRWRSICRGILLTGNGRLTRDQQLWVAVLAAGPRAVLAGATAAAEAGVRGLRREPLHVLVPADRRAGMMLRRLPIDMPGVVVHRTRVLPEEHLQLARPPRTSIARSVVDAASWARSAEGAQLALAAACQQRRMLPAEMVEVLRRLPRAPRRRLIRQALADIAGGAEALSELDFLALCRRHRLPRPDLQERGRMGRVAPAGWTRTGASGGCTWRSTAHTTWTSGTGRTTCAGRTTSGRLETGSSASPPGWSAPTPTRSPPPSTAPSRPPAGVHR